MKNIYVDITDDGIAHGHKKDGIKKTKIVPKENSDDYKKLEEKIRNTINKMIDEGAYVKRVGTTVTIKKNGIIPSKKITASFNNNYDDSLYDLKKDVMEVADEQRGERIIVFKRNFKIAMATLAVGAVLLLAKKGYDIYSESHTTERAIETLANEVTVHGGGMHPTDGDLAGHLKKDNCKIPSDGSIKGDPTTNGYFGDVMSIFRRIDKYCEENELSDAICEEAKIAFMDRYLGKLSIDQQVDLKYQVYVYYGIKIKYDNNGKYSDSKAIKKVLMTIYNEEKDKDNTTRKTR